MTSPWRDCSLADGVPLGAAVPDNALYVLDGTTVAGGGQVGEIGLAGAGLAIGYLDDPDQGGAEPDLGMLFAYAKRGNELRPGASVLREC